MSVVSVGEIYRIAARGTHPWGTRKRQALAELLTGVVTVPLAATVLERYGVLGAFLDAQGRPIPQNDVWIAASAGATNAVLLTTDTDFDVLHSAGLLEREFVHPDVLPAGP